MRPVGVTIPPKNTDRKKVKGDARSCFEYVITVRGSELLHLKIKTNAAILMFSA